MRTLCLQLNDNYNENVRENFLAFSSRVKFRRPGLLFADVTDSITKFGGEKPFLRELASFNKDFFPQAKAAIASTPSLAQIFNHSQDGYFHCTPQEESIRFKELPLAELHNLEGLVAWSSQEEVEDIITFFRVLGFETIGDIHSFNVGSFRQRWGKTGESMWKKLHGDEKQLITPIKNNSSYVDNLELSFPISLKPYLLHTLENHCRKLLNAIKRDRCEATKLVVYLHCEYNYDVHMIEILPNDSYLNLMYIYEALEKKLCSLELANPIRKMDVEFFACRPHGTKFFSWHKKQIKNKHSSQIKLCQTKPVVSGSISPQTYDHYDSDWILVEGLDDSPAKVDVGGQQLELNICNLKTEPWSPRLELYDTMKELPSLKDYKCLSPTENSAYGLGDGGSERGRSYFVALDEFKNKVCICFDHLEQRYFLKGLIS